MRLEVRQGSKVVQLHITQDEQNLSVLDILRNYKIKIQADCGGIRRCGKCRVQFLKGAPDANATEKELLSEEEMLACWRLACMAIPTDGSIICVPELGEDCMEIQATYSRTGNDEAVCKQVLHESANRTACENSYGIAADIGTTTIVISLVELHSGKTLDTYTTVNHQRRWGGDVISRIQASEDGYLKALQESVCDDVRQGMGCLLAAHGLSETQLQKIVIAGNTTMGHLLCGFPCKGLGMAPYTPVDISTIRRCANDLFGWKDSQAEVILLPGISAFVGADIVAGMYTMGLQQSNEVCLFIDLGTNGEMAIGNKERFMVASTAAGPAFEGGNISCGMASVQGAICHVQMEKGQIYIKTIGEKEPVGLCGTGVIETVYELFTNQMIDTTGLLEDAYFENGLELGQTPDGKKIFVSQKDIREIQLAKAAIRAGVESLLLEFGASYDDIAHVYIAGGFGYQMDLSKAVGIGMFPKELLPKMQAVGNSSLGGAICALLEEAAISDMEHLAAVSEEINLAMTSEFGDFYMEYMMF